MGMPGSVVFQVFADGTQIYDSGLLTGADDARLVDVDVTEVDELRLVVTTGLGGNAYDHAAWADARVLYRETTGTPRRPANFQGAALLSTDVQLPGRTNLPWKTASRWSGRQTA